MANGTTHSTRHAQHTNLIYYRPLPTRYDDMPACDHGRVSATRLVTLDDIPVLAELLRANRDFLAPWQPIWGDDYFTVDGQLAVIRAALERHEQGSTLPHVILDDSGGVVGR